MGFFKPPTEPLEPNSEITEKKMEILMESILIDTLEVLKSDVLPSELILNADQQTYTSKNIFKGADEPVEIYTLPSQIMYGMNILQQIEGQTEPRQRLDSGEMIVCVAPTFKGAKLKNSALNKQIESEVIKMHGIKLEHSFAVRHYLAKLYMKGKNMPISPEDWKTSPKCSEIFIVYNNAGKHFSYTKYPEAYIDEHGNSQLKYVRRVEEVPVADDGFIAMGFSEAMIPAETASLLEFTQNELRTYIISPKKTEPKPLASTEKRKAFGIKSILSPRPT